MMDLAGALRELVLLFERLEAPYAVMGGLAVRVYGIPRPTYDIDFTAAIERQDLPDFYQALRGLGHTVPEVYQCGPRGVGQLTYHRSAALRRHLAGSLAEWNTPSTNTVSFWTRYRTR